MCVSEWWAVACWASKPLNPAVVLPHTHSGPPWRVCHIVCPCGEFHLCMLFKSSRRSWLQRGRRVPLACFPQVRAWLDPSPLPFDFYAFLHNFTPPHPCWCNQWVNRLGSDFPLWQSSHLLLPLLHLTAWHIWRAQQGVAESSSLSIKWSISMLFMIHFVTFQEKWGAVFQ